MHTQSNSDNRRLGPDGGLAIAWGILRLYRIVTGAGGSFESEEL